MDIDAEADSPTLGLPIKRRKVQRSPSPPNYLLEDDDSYEPYVPVAQRRQAKLAKLTSRASVDRDDASRKQQEQEEREDEEKEEERQRERTRKERTLLMEAQEVHHRKAAEGISQSCLSSPVVSNYVCRC